jgi:Na+/H+ antiporter NhaA
MLTFIVSSIVAAVLIKKKGRYWPVMVVMPVFLCIGAGLLFTIDATSSFGRNLGYQILFGLGIGEPRC